MYNIAVMLPAFNTCPEWYDTRRWEAQLSLNETQMPGVPIIGPSVLDDLLFPLVTQGVPAWRVGFCSSPGAPSQCTVLLP